MGALKPIQYKIIGMQKDNSESAFDNKYSFENKNVRITSLNDNSQLNIVNEKGTKIVNILNKTSDLYEDRHFIPNTDLLELRGIPIGYSILDNDLIIFTTENTFTPIDIIDNNTILTISTLFGNVQNTEFLLNYSLKGIKNLTNTIKSGLKIEIDIDFITYLNPTIPIRNTISTIVGNLSGLVSINLPEQCAFIIINIIKVFYNNQLLYKTFPGKLYTVSSSIEFINNNVNINELTSKIFNNGINNSTNIMFPKYDTTIQNIEQSIPTLNIPNLMPLNVINGSITRTANIGRGINYAFKNNLNYNINYRYYQFNIDTELLEYIPLGYPFILPNSYFGLIHFYQKDYVIEPPIIINVTNIEVTNIPDTVILGNTYIFTATALPLSSTNRNLSFSFDKPGIKLNYVTLLVGKPEDVNQIIYSVSFTVIELEDNKTTDIINLIITPESNTNLSTLYPLTIIKPFLNVRANSNVNVEKVIFDSDGNLLTDYSNIITVYSNIQFTINKPSIFDWITTNGFGMDIYDGIDKEFSISVLSTTSNRSGYITITPLNNTEILNPINFIIEQQGTELIIPTDIIISSNIVNQIAYGETFTLDAYISPNNSNNKKLNITFDTSKVKLISQSIISNEDNINVYSYNLQVITNTINDKIDCIFTSDSNPEITNLFSIDIVEPIFSVYTLDNTNISNIIEFNEFGELKSGFSNIVRILSNIKYNIYLSDSTSSWISIDKILGDYDNNQDILVTCLSNNLDILRECNLLITPTNNNMIQDSINITIKQDSTSIVYAEDINVILETDKLYLVPLEANIIKSVISPNNSTNFHTQLIGENINASSDVIISDNYSNHTSVIEFILTDIPNKQVFSIQSVNNPSITKNIVYQIQEPTFLITLNDKIPNIIQFDSNGFSQELENSIFNINTNITYRLTSDVSWISILEIQQSINVKYNGNITLQCEENISNSRTGNIYFTSVYNNELINQKIITIQQDGI